MSSNRMKRLLKELNDIRGGGYKRKRHLSGSDDEDSRVSGSSRLLSEFGQINSNIYNSSTHSKPAELFRKDLISAMKMADTEQLDPKEYIIINDSWKQDWERGVQVPVNPDSFHKPSFRVPKSRNIRGDFKMPKKYLRTTHNEFFSNDIHSLVNVASKADKVCRYDIDSLDDHWLKTLNEERQMMGLSVINEETLEIVMEEFEMACFEKIQKAIQNEQPLGIEFDEDVICDVCRSPDSEEGNEMVFCDMCDICVHQACYGITTIPSGSWMCKTCVHGFKPSCILCPYKDGAMKPVKGSNKWAHVSCALWIPEVSIGCVEKMEPITKTNLIPSSRWNLICLLCKERSGACIQCSVKTCKIAYHVTCAFKNCLEMKAILEESETESDGVKLRSYCSKHSQKIQAQTAEQSKDKNVVSSPPPSVVESDSDDESEEEQTDAIKQKLSMLEDKNNAKNDRFSRIQQIETDFFKYVNIDVVSETLQVAKDVVDFIYQYWKLKRQANFTKPLLRPQEVETDLLNKQQEDSLYEKMKLFVHLRQDLERVRNLCYMINRREKLSRSYLHVRSEVFTKQSSVLNDETLMLTDRERQSVIHANHCNNVYDRLFCDAAKHPCRRNIVAILSTLNQHTRPDRIKKPKKSFEPNPYAKQYNFNRILNRSVRKSDDSPTRNVDKELVEESCSSTTSVTADYENVTLMMTDFKRCSVMVGKDDDLFSEMENKDFINVNTNCQIKKEVDKEKMSGENEDDLVIVSPKNDANVNKLKRVNNKRSKDESTTRLKKSKLRKSQLFSQNREKLREMNAKVRESMFSNSVLPKSSVLGGYKIPKKNKNSVDSNLKSECEISHDRTFGEDNDKSYSPQQLLVCDNNYNYCNGGDSSPPRLVIKLRKDPNYPPESSRWRSESDVSSSLSSDESSPQLVNPEGYDRVSENSRSTRHSHAESTGGLSTSKNSVTNLYPIRSRRADLTDKPDERNSRHQQSF